MRSSGFSFQSAATPRLEVVHGKSEDPQHGSALPSQLGQAVCFWVFLCCGPHGHMARTHARARSGLMNECRRRLDQTLLEGAAGWLQHKNWLIQSRVARSSLHVASNVARALIYGHRFFQLWWRFSSWEAHVAWSGCGSNICLLLAVTSCVFGLTGVSVGEHTCKGINNLCPTGGFTANNLAPEFYISIRELLLSYVHVWWREKKKPIQLSLFVWNRSG